MVRKRGYDNVYEREFFKMSRTRTQPSTSSSNKGSNSLNNGLLKLYKKTTNADSDVDLSNDAENTPNKSKRKSYWVETPSNSIKRVKKTLNKVLVPQNSSIKLRDVGGISYLYKDIFRLFYHLKFPHIYQKLKVSPVRAFLIHGPPGCGKTYLARAIAGEFEMPLIEILSSELVCGVSGESESKIRDIFNSAISAGRCILFLDNIDAITPKREDASGGMEKRMVFQLEKCLDELYENDSNHNVMVIGATRNPDSIESSLRGGGRFNREIAMGMPNEDDKLHILKILFNGMNLAPEVDLAWVAHQAAGYVASDLTILKEIVTAAAVERFCDPGQEIHQQNSPEAELENFVAWFHSKDEPDPEFEPQIELEDFKNALKQCVPVCKKEGFASVPDVTWEDVGALEHVKVELQKSILRPVKFNKYYERNHLRITKGILLHGPKGCGKTLIAKALANECNINFLSVKGPELVSKFLGESERAVRKVFERARHSAPCIIFFDEFDALASNRSNAPSSDATNRVVNQLLTEMDGMQERKLVFVIAATNRLEKIDSAMRRPGRLDKIIYIGLPSPKGRVDILRSLTKHKTRPKIADDLSLERIAFDERCNGFSGADLDVLVGQATEIAMDKNVNIARKEKQHDKYVELVDDHGPIDWSDFDKAFQVVKPSFNKMDEKSFGIFERENALKRELELDE